MGELWVLFCSEGGHTPTAPLKFPSLPSAQGQNLQADDSPVLGYSALNDRAGHLPKKSILGNIKPHTVHSAILK